MRFLIVFIVKLVNLFKREHFRVTKRAEKEKKIENKVIAIYRSNQKW